MAVVGIGVDIVDVTRFVATLHRTPALRERLFTPAEAALSDESLAARFAAKEALAKALGAPPHLQWADAEVTTMPDGRPELVVSGSVARAAAALHITSWHVSLSHDGGMAIAMVVAET